MASPRSSGTHRDLESLPGSLTADKIGAYRGWARFPMTIWEDGFVRTSSFEATAARLP